MKERERKSARRRDPGVYLRKAARIACAGIFAWNHATCHLIGQTLVQADDPVENIAALSLEELMDISVDTVFGASKYLQKVTDAPASVSIVSHEDIARYGYRSFDEILRSVRGLNMSNDRNYTYLGFRGFNRPGDYNSRSLLLVNGYRTNDTVYDGILTGRGFSLDVDLIDQVEVIRGPGSSIYGTSAFFGVVNVVSKSGGDLEGGRASATVGSFGTYKARLSYGRKLPNGLDFLCFASFTESDGENEIYFPEYDDPETNNGVYENGDYERLQHFFGKIALRGLSVEGGYQRRKKGIPTSSYGTVFNDSRNHTIDYQLFLNAKFEHEFADQSTLSAQIHYDKTGYDGLYIYDYEETGARQDFSSYIDYLDGRYWGVELQLKKQIADRHIILAGFEYKDNFRMDQVNFDEGSEDEPYLDDRRESRIWSPFVQAEILLRPNLRINAGLRYDHFDSFGGTTNPRIALIYHHSQNTSFKFLYGTAFRAPSAFELYFNDGGETHKGNTSLGPEEIRTFEGVVEHSFGTHLRASLSLFRYHIENLISNILDPDDELLVFENVDVVETTGAEIELECRWDNRLLGRFSYSFHDTVNLTTNETLSNSPAHMAKFNLSIPLARKNVYAGVEIQYTGDRRTLAGGNAGDHTLVNLTLLSRTLIKGVDLSASVYNVFDDRYGDPGGPEHFQQTIPQVGRNFRVKFDYRF